MSRRESYEKANSLHQKSRNISEEVLLKKRSLLWSNEVHPVLNAVNSPHGDRFIAKRSTLADNEFNKKLFPQRTPTDVLKTPASSNYWWQNNLADIIDRYIDIDDQRVLQFTKHPMPEDIAKPLLLPSRAFTNGSDWPCRARKQPLAFPDATHDLPGLNTFFDHNLVDWSINEQLAVSFGHDIIVWERHYDLTMIFAVNRPRALAYSPSGRILAIGCMVCDYPVVELWDVSSFNEFIVLNGRVLNPKNLEVKCIEWTRTSDALACGTESGTIFILVAPTLHKLHKIKERSQLPISMLRFAPNMRYLASGDKEGNVTIYHWNSCEIYLRVASRRKLHVTFDWHPWSGADMVISEKRPASIIILHIPSKQIVAYYQRNDTKMSINSITFSKLTGELVVSVSRHGMNGCIDLKILVLAALDRLVDVISVPENGAQFVIWSPDGTKLATLGSDETLTIWHFSNGSSRDINRTSITSNQAAFDEKEFLGLASKYGRHFQLWSSLK